MRNRGLSIFFPVTIFIAACVLSSMAHSGEYLRCGMPGGWQVLTERSDARMSVTELIPEGEAPSRWTQRITLQTFHGRADALPSQWLESFQAHMGRTCPNLSFSGVALFRDNGLSAARMMMYCPDLSACAQLPPDPQAPRGEITDIKAIRGTNHLYVVQRAWRGRVFEDPSRSGMPRHLMCEWLKFFENVQVDGPK